MGSWKDNFQEDQDDQEDQEYPSAPRGTTGHEKGSALSTGGWEWGRGRSRGGG